jgi:nucleotide-binding universal stress UspA family protein
MVDDAVRSAYPRCSASTPGPPAAVRARALGGRSGWRPRRPALAGQRPASHRHPGAGRRGEQHPADGGANEAVEQVVRRVGIGDEQVLADRVVLRRTAPPAAGRGMKTIAAAWRRSPLNAAIGVQARSGDAAERRSTRGEGFVGPLIARAARSWRFLGPRSSPPSRTSTPGTSPRTSRRAERGYQLVFVVAANLAAIVPLAWLTGRSKVMHASQSAGGLASAVGPGGGHHRAQRLPARAGDRNMSFSRILVPLDGSRLAEAVLPAARSLAERLAARLLLLHVLEREPPAAVHGEPHLGTAREARAYLEQQEQELRQPGISVESHVHEPPVDDVAEAIDAHAGELDADLIAMCAHGRSNLRTRRIGSIAERILRGGGVPICLRTVRRPDLPDFDLRHLLVPIDFGHDVDAALAAARALARPYGAAVTLLSALEPPAPPTSRLLPAMSALTREYELDDLGRRLEELADRTRGEIGDVRSVVADQPPTKAILAVTDSLPADLIVLVTDAHGGLSSWYDPSTGQELLRRPDLTLLLIKER